MTTTTSAGLISISVGEISPFQAQPADQLTVGVSLAHPMPVIIVSLPEVTDEDIVNIKAPLTAVGLRRSAALPSGAVVLVLGVSPEEVWAICVPFLDEAQVMRAWADSTTETSTALIVMVDAGTQIVQAQRTIDLPPRLLDMVRQGIKQASDIDEQRASDELSALGDRQIWAQSTRWQDLDSSGVYTMVAEAPVQA